ncbi:MULTISPECIES: hypothetical protein [unclassified Streptomyces]|uniref:hypothetical protein n=1 Tax=unclassified Streptomyces TaxID=2593676 RepID=UPI00336A28A7
MSTEALPWTPPNGRDIKVVPTGQWWDAVRVPKRLGEHALGLLGDQSGAVIQDSHGPMYWLVTPGTADNWGLQQVHVLGASTAGASYVGVPPAHWTSRPGTHWRIPVDPERYLTDAQLLHEALSQAANPIHSTSTEPSTSGARCDHP